ncbi:MAG: DUF3108 domain-containing protein [Saprospiraceae bacterium]|nr:DUF3108 domain-containing protein [Saprospiraceae bacterium]
MNRPIWLLLWALVFMASGPPVESEDRSVKEPEASEDFNLCSIENTAFKGGEEIVYKVYYNWNFVWLSAGEVTFRVRELDDTYHITARGRTFKSYEWFYKVRDNYDSFIDKESLLPVMSIRDIEEGKYRLYDRVSFDRVNKLAKSFRGKSRETAEPQSHEVSSCIHDILSVLYYSRNIDYHQLEIGSKMPVNIFMDEESWPLTLTYRGAEKDVKVKGLGRFNTLKFSPDVITGDIFSEDTEMNIWVSDDKNRIPVLIESPLSVGSVKVVLQQYEGLRYDMEAMVD